jgi:cyclic pyranopterin phosphate synthase
MSDGRLSHLDEHGRARMVDVGAKEPSERVARARARLRMSPDTARAVQSGQGPKGEVLAVARLAGVQAAKQTGNLIPLAHPLPITFADVQASVDVQAGLVTLLSDVRTRARTGVEMEAMSACAVAALTVYDMVKGLERGAEIEQIVLLEKHGGKSDYRRQAAEDEATGERRTAEEPPTPAAPASAPRAPLRAALVTISTSKAAGDGVDESGERLAALAHELGAEVIARELIPDERQRIEELLRELSEREDCDLILTSGGTGLSPNDVTPEATRAVVEREVPGIAEAMRAASRPHTRHWMLSRALAGVRAGTLIVNLPGNPASIAQIGGAIAPALPHAAELAAGLRSRH